MIDICVDCAESEPVPTAVVVGTGIPVQACMGEEIVVVNALTWHWQRALCMTSLVWARELAATSMQLQSMYNMVRCYELELNRSEERSREEMAALLAKHESEIQAQKDEIESLRSQVNLMQMLLQGLQIAEKVDSDDYQP